MSALDAPPSPLFSHEETITSEELFNSFMDVVVAAENEHVIHERASNGKKGDFDSLASNVAKQHATVDMPLPLLLKKSATPIYETVADTGSSVIRPVVGTDNNVTHPAVNNNTNIFRPDLGTDTNIIRPAVNTDSPSSPTSPYDKTTGDELFDSFMSLALSVERQQTVGDGINGNTNASRHGNVDMPLPLLLKKGASPIYEVVDNTVEDKGVRSLTKGHTTSKDSSSRTTTTCSVHQNTTNHDYFILEPKHNSPGRNNSRGANTIVSVSPTVKTFSKPDYPEPIGKVGVKRYERDDDLKPYDTIIDSYQQQHQQYSQQTQSPTPSTNDLYAVVDMSQKQRDRREAAAKRLSLGDATAANPPLTHTVEDGVDRGHCSKGGTTPLEQQHNNAHHYLENESDYATIEKHSKAKTDTSDGGVVVNKIPAYDDDDYEDIVTLTTTVFKSSNGSIPNTLLTNNDTSNTMVDSYDPGSHVLKNDRRVIKSSNSDYEDVSALLICDNKKKKVKNLSPEDVAFGLKRLHTEGQATLYQSCLNTIERGARWGSIEKKKTFFHFGKSKSVDKIPDEKANPMNRRASIVPSICSGYLFKQGGTGITPKNWRLRWFELKKDNCLYYYKNEQDPTPAGAVMLTKYSVTRAVEANKRFSFKLTKGGGRTYYFAANSEDEMKKWMKNLGEAVSIANSDPTSIPECSLKNVSVPAISISEPDCHGFLWKQGNIHKSWRRRYCVLKYGCLFYYEDMSDQVAIGVFKLNNYTVSENFMGEVSKYGFKALAPGRKMRSYFFYAESEIDSRRWIEALKHSVATRSQSTSSTTTI